MLLEDFFDFVEIRTKFASVIPFALGTVYSIYHFNSFILINFVLMLISILAFDMATTAINNYCDHKKILKTDIGNLKPKTYYIIILLLLAIAVMFGIILTIKTNIVVLLLGVFSFTAGILYSFGPVSISRMPLGEIFSGLFMGFIIIFLSIYIHIFNLNIVSIVYLNKILIVKMEFLEVMKICLFAVPAVTGIANIMLANNIRDVNTDILFKRYTLPHYIGKQNSLKLFSALYYICYIDIFILALFRVIPVVSLLIIFTIFPVKKNITAFKKNPTNDESFILSVKNFVIINLPQIIIIETMILLR